MYLKTLLIASWGAGTLLEGFKCYCLCSGINHAIVLGSILGRAKVWPSQIITQLQRDQKILEPMCHDG